MEMIKFIAMFTLLTVVFLQAKFVYIPSWVLPSIIILCITGYLAGHYGSKWYKNNGQDRKHEE